MNAALTAKLREWSDALSALEADAGVQLHEKKNETAYRDLMRQRAELLRSLPQKAEALPADIRQSPAFSQVLEALRAFAEGADNALRLNSVFYMSALLYPDEHQPGEPNNLEQLIRAMERG